MQTTTEQKAYILGIITRELNVNFDDVSQEELVGINKVLEDVLLDEPETDLGKKIKEIVKKEQEDTEGDYNKSFNFHKDLNENKIIPTTKFILEVLSTYSQRIIDNDETVEQDILAEIVKKMNELNYPNGYIQSPFNTILATINKISSALKGQVEHREDEIKSLSIGIRHPKYNTLSHHLSSFKDMDNAIKRLRETFNFTEEDYRSK